MISVVQNFVCRKPDRLEVINRNTPKLADTLGDYEFFVNFNDSINYKEVANAYFDNIPKLNFYNDLKKDWASVALALMENVDTFYVMYLCEDYEVNMTKQSFKDILEEAYNTENVDYILLGKIGKYTLPRYIERYKELKYGYTYCGQNAPHKRLSLNGIYHTDFFKERLKEFILHKDDCVHDIPYKSDNLPNYYEGYYDFANGMKRFADMKCYIPKKEIFIEYTDTLEKL